MVEVHCEELDYLLEQGEDHTLDYKSADLLIPAGEDEMREIARQLVGFANQEGGKLVFGVDDETRTPEGKNIKKEEAEGTISKVARDWCSPPIDFKTEEFYSSKKDEVEEGTVLVIKVNSSDDIPPAVVENSGSEVKRREYRLRTGDETRLVADEELKQLFENQLDPDIEDRIRSWYFYSRDKPTPGYHPEPGQCHRPLNATWSQNSIAHYLYWLSSEDVDRWIPEGARGLNNLIQEIVPLAIVHQLSEAFRDTWHIEWNDHKIDGHGKSPNISTEVVEIDRSKFDENAIYQLDETDIDWYSRFKEFGNQIMVPKGTDVKVVDRGTIPGLVFEKDNKFRIEIGVVRETYHTIPTNHPYSGVRSARRAYEKDTNHNWRTCEFDINLTIEYGFPEIRDDHIESHKSFADQLQNTLFHFWSTEVVIENLPDSVTYEINEKMDILLEMMEDM